MLLYFPVTTVYMDLLNQLCKNFAHKCWIASGKPEHRAAKMLNDQKSHSHTFITAYIFCKQLSG